MFAYFLADTDEAQVMPHTRPVPSQLPISSLTAMNFFIYLGAVAKFAVCLPTNLHFLINAAACITNMLQCPTGRGQSAETGAEAGAGVWLWTL